MFGKTNRKDSGAIVIDGQHVSSTLQCVHCGSHHMVRVGSKVRRGFCTRCNGFVCGQFSCMVACIPFEAKIEYEEAINANNEKQIRKILSRYPKLNTVRL